MDPFQSNQAFHSSLSSSRRLCPSEENLPLWCLIQGDRQAFKVVPPLCLCIDIDDLKRVIHAGTESMVPPKDLTLWKVWAISKKSQHCDRFLIAEGIGT